MRRLPNVSSVYAGDGIDAVRDWTRQFKEILQEPGTGATWVEVEADEGGESAFEVHLRAVIHGVELQRSLGAEFFRSVEYQRLVELSGLLDDTLEAGSEVRRGDRFTAATSLAQAMDWLSQEAKRGMSIQRYKGLGEMNPDQLWETTMDPATRRMLQVRIEDAVATDELFTTLMGDHVEPRRDFIQNNALSVANLDA
jgi:DNA gyrase subunit B